jgi:cbb3-type cytochrome oxidase subunit 3
MNPDFIELLHDEAFIWFVVVLIVGTYIVYKIQNRGK